MRIRCPTCGKQDEVTEEFQWRPFCSRRCKIIDLGNWLDEVYRFSRPVGSDEGRESTRPIGAEGALLSHLMASGDDDR